MRNGVAIMVLAILGACSAEPESPPDDLAASPAPAVTAPGGVEQWQLPFAERVDPNPDRGSWMQALTPTSADNCTFTEHPAADRPPGLEMQAWSGNMDLLGEGELLGHDHAIGFVEANWLADKPVIAVRDGMPDLWIEPVAPYDNVILRIGADEFVCVRWDG